MTMKKLTGTTKLSGKRESRSVDEKLNLIKKRKHTKSTSFRLTESDLSRLRKVSETVSEVGEKNISQTAVIKGLISLGERIKPERLLKIIREVS
jgi:hypothetical protein